MPRLSKIGAAALAAFGWTAGATVSASYLVVAGGGGGGGATSGASNGGSGGGAGGYRTGTASLNPTLSYTVTVGAGGSAGPSSGGAAGKGNDSVFNAITSTGGGYGIQSGGAANGGSGGSGGGAAGGGTVGSGNTPSTSPSQGNNGGSGLANACGGGGGAGAVGGNASGAGLDIGGNGGAGSASSISGLSVTYAGGGGAGGYSGGSNGGTGGGGNGGNSPTSGTPNTGGGGGGGNGNVGALTGGAGGSGVVIISYPAPQKFGGGIVTTSGSNVIHTFNTSGTLTPLSSLTASYLVVAGGGGGGTSDGNWITGGGGAGGLLTGSGLTIDSNSIYTVTVGAGGAAETNGSNSLFSMVTTTAVGGGRAFRGTPAGSGGSGGGSSNSTTTETFGTGTVGQGNNGGTLGSATAGGGGGAGAVGGNGSITAGGNGGNGTTVSAALGGGTYAGGGGGGGASSIRVAGTGGSGGGGAGALGNNVTATAGTANTGGGGGGNGQLTGVGTGGTGGAGGSGVVIISYAGATQLMAGGTVTITGGNVIHTFTSSGYLTPIKLVNNSLRFRSSASAYLNRTFTTPTDSTKFTFSAWIKRGSLGSSQGIFQAGNTNYIQFGSADTIQLVLSNTTQLTTASVYRDPAAWGHLVISYNNAVSPKWNFYYNSVNIGTSTASNTTLNTATAHGIANPPSGGGYFDGYMTEVQFVDGQALTPNSFGTFNSYGVWQPITYGGSYGTNGFYLPFTNKTSTTTLGYDFSPNGNNWTTNNISLTAGSTYDSMTDVPTLTSATAANYPTWNPLVPSGQAAPTDGNLSQINSTGCRTATMPFPQSGKWYLEWLAGSNTMAIVVGSPFVPTTQANSQTYSVGYYNNGNKYIAGTATAYGASFTSGDIIGLALDFTVSPPTITYYKNNASQGSINLTSGIDYYVAAGIGGTGLEVINFGQRPFSYTPPTGYVALNTYNL